LFSLQPENSKVKRKKKKTRIMLQLKASNLQPFCVLCANLRMLKINVTLCNNGGALRQIGLERVWSE
jgi:hypothetical protein